MSPALSLFSRRRWPLSLVAVAILGFGLGVARWPSSGALAADDDKAFELRFISSADQSLGATLRAGGVDVADSNAVAFALADVLDPARPPPNLQLDLTVEHGGTGDAPRIISMVLRKDGQAVGAVTRAADQSFRFTRDAGAKVELPTTVVKEVPTVLQGPMEDVLYGDPGATSDAAIILQAARLFARKLDLSRDLALGERVRLVYTRKVAEDGRIIGPGDLLYAEIDTATGPARFYRHQRISGLGAEYVDESGGETSAGLLRTPVDGARITSNFGMRMHPLLGFTRMHQGLDFGAPVGSEVLAAGDGVVEEARWAGGYGRWIKLRHSADLETGYGHLSRWADTIRVGARIHQGEVIGFVGSSGLSTGPHLHYEVLEAGRPVDPKNVEAGGRTMLTGADLAKLVVEKRWIDALLDQPKIVQAQPRGAGLNGTN